MSNITINAIYVLTSTLLGGDEQPPHSIIQAVRSPWAWREIDQRKQLRDRKRIRLNVYTPPTTSRSRQAVHTSVTFGGRRDGTMRLERRNITSNLPSTPSTHQSAPPDEGDLFCFTADDDSMPMDDILGDNETLHQRRKQMAAVRLSFQDTYPCLLTGA